MGQRNLLTLVQAWYGASAWRPACHEVKELSRETALTTRWLYICRAGLGRLASFSLSRPGLTALPYPLRCSEARIYLALMRLSLPDYVPFYYSNRQTGLGWSAPCKPWFWFLVLVLCRVGQILV